MNYCNCGLPLDRYLNKRYDGTVPGYCNKKCQDKYENPKPPKNRKKYGPTGYVYDGYKSGDIFKKRGNE